MLLILLANKSFHDKLDLLQLIATLSTRALATSEDLGNLLLLLPPLVSWTRFSNLITCSNQTRSSSSKFCELPNVICKLLNLPFISAPLSMRYSRDSRMNSWLEALSAQTEFSSDLPRARPRRRRRLALILLSSTLPCWHANILLLTFHLSFVVLLLTLPFSFQAPGRQDQRQDQRHQRQDQRKRTDPSRPAPSWERQDRPRRSAPDRPASSSGAPRRLIDDDDNRQELVSLQQALQSVVAKLSGPKTSKSSSDSPSANMAADDPVQHSVHQEATYHAQLQSDSDSDVNLYH